MAAVTLKEIAKAINVKLKAALPDIEIQSKDISEGYARPSLFVDIDDVQTAKYGANGRERTVSTTVYYFPSDRHTYKIEMLDAQEKLEQAFAANLAIREGFVVFPSELRSVKVDGVLQTSFDLYYIEMLEDPGDGNAEFMGSLETKLNEREG